MIVVQNVYPFEQEPQLDTQVAARVVNNSVRVIANPLPPYAQRLLAAVIPMPVPLQGPPAAATPPPAQTFGFRQALGQGLLQHWTIEP
jgi:hypothetical protein